MKTLNALKLAVSTLVVGTAVSFGGHASFAERPAKASSAAALLKVAVTAAANAQAALAERKGVKAVSWAERAVAASPQDASYRFLLGESYLAAGRYKSAETAFADTLRLNPGHDRAVLKMALAQIAQGRTAEALAVLEEHRSALAVADYGLAVALAGDPQAAVRTLEQAARDIDATAKTRQNLALAYALSGRWVEARTIAAQDLPVDMVSTRIGEWAVFARPAAASDQVSSLLGVTPTFDGGQPVALALIMQPAQALAAVEPEAAPVVEQVAVAADPELPTLPEPTFEAAPVVQSVAVAPVMRAEPTPLKQIIVPTGQKTESIASARQVQGGKFAVQLGAFSSVARADAAWSKVSRKFASISHYDPSRSRVHVKKASLFRLSVSGFTSREDAGRVCSQVKAAGGACFVRSAGADAPMQWASRGNGTRLAARR
ncbi:MAG: SPOR domain-containing protein [Chakrabartia sp.]